MKTNTRGFTPLEIILVIATFGFVFSLIFAFLSDAWRDARDEKRIEDLEHITQALNRYYHDHGEFPEETAGANGNVAKNTFLQELLSPYLSAIPTDPAGTDDPTFFYYYDGAHRCGSDLYAAVFARQMDIPKHANYQTLASERCAGSLDSEGRGGGTESYTVIVGPSSDSR